MSERIQQYTFTYLIPWVGLIKEYAEEKEMGMKEWLDYEHKYHRFKKLEKIRLNGIPLNEEDFEEYERLGAELHELCKKILSKK